VRHARGCLKVRSHGLTAVDHEGVTDGEGGLARAQPQDGRGDLFGVTHPPDGLLLEDGLASLWGVAEHSFDHDGVDDPGADGVDPDSYGAAYSRAAHLVAPMIRPQVSMV
jgi:hypothetical protein